MGELEIRAIAESKGYEEEDVEYIADIFNELMKHKDFKDRRRDGRFIVKFHQIFWYMPDEKELSDEERNAFEWRFEDFCEQQYHLVLLDIRDNAPMELKEMLTSYDVGHYPAFMVDIPEINENNALDLAIQIYDEYNWKGEDYVKSYIYAVNLLQDLEDNYMEYWLEYLDGDETITKEHYEQMKAKYNSDKEKKCQKIIGHQKKEL